MSDGEPDPRPALFAGVFEFGSSGRRQRPLLPGRRSGCMATLSLFACLGGQLTESVAVSQDGEVFIGRDSASVKGRPGARRVSRQQVSVVSQGGSSLLIKNCAPNAILCRGEVVSEGNSCEILDGDIICLRHNGTFPFHCSSKDAASQSESDLLQLCDRQLREMPVKRTTTGRPAAAAAARRPTTHAFEDESSCGLCDVCGADEDDGIHHDGGCPCCVRLETDDIIKGISTWTDHAAESGEGAAPAKPFQPRRSKKAGRSGPGKSDGKETPLDRAVMRHASAGHAMFFVEIGASDGVTGDPLYKHVQSGALKRGLVVEPLPDLFDLLSSNYAEHRSGVDLANVAIAASNSKDVDMMRIPLDACQSLPKWVRGTSSLRPECTPLSGKNVSAALFSQIAPLIQHVSVETCTLQTLLDRYAVDKVDVLQLDCEGMDWLILQQLDWEKYQPWIINFEAINLPPDELAECKGFLEGKGFQTVRYKYDMTAWRTNDIVQ